MENKIINGGAGSGDFGHAGREGLVGGSEPIESREKRGFGKYKQTEKSEEKHLIPKITPVEPSRPTYNPPPVKEPDRNPKKHNDDDFEKILQPLLNPEKQKTSEDLRKEFRKYQDEIFEKHKKGVLTDKEHQEYLKRSKDFNNAYKKLITRENNKKYREMAEQMKLFNGKKANNSLYKHEFIEY